MQKANSELNRRRTNNGRYQTSHATNWLLLLFEGKEHREMEGALLIMSAQHLLSGSAYECYQLCMDVEV